MPHNTKEKQKEYQKKYYLENKEKIKEYRLKNKKHLSECLIKYRLDNKEKIAKSSKEYRLKNKEKIAKSSKEHYLKNKEFAKKYSKKYRLDNKEKIKEQQKKWVFENQEHLIKYRKEHNKKYCLDNREKISQQVKNRRRLDCNFRLSHNLRVRLNQVLKGKNKSASTMELLGCSIDKLWNHLESKFESWMTKENYGLWHVDHKIACAKFDLTCPEQQRVCFHYTNLQPMEAIENMRKGAR